MTNIDPKELKEEVARIDDMRLLDEYRVKYLGKHGLLTKEFQNLAKLGPDEKRKLGERLNQLKQDVSGIIEDRIKAVKEERSARTMQTETIDVTLRLRTKRFGKLHPITHVSAEILSIFTRMGFSTATGPDVDNEYNNFTALNFPPNHPAKEMHDTFYVDHTDDQGAPLLLRTHTSTVQVREMKKSKPPYKFVSLGKVYRCDHDATHTPMFHQIEGVCIDKQSNMADMKGCLYEFAHAFFANKPGLNIRLRPSYFPFVEPGAEIDIRFGDDSQRWLEILGCGMVHPNVLRNLDLDPEVYQGFAFGMGIERCAMLKYDIEDCRAFYEGDIRWLRHYGFNFLKSA